MMNEDLFLLLLAGLISSSCGVGCFAVPSWVWFSGLSHILWRPMPASDLQFFPDYSIQLNGKLYQYIRIRYIWILNVMNKPVWLHILIQVIHRSMALRLPPLCGIGLPMGWWSPCCPFYVSWRRHADVRYVRYVYFVERRCLQKFCLMQGRHYVLLKCIFKKYAAALPTFPLRKGLEDCIGYSIVHPTWQRSRPDKPDDLHHGWMFCKPGDAPLSNGLGSLANLVVKEQKKSTVYTNLYTAAISLCRLEFVTSNRCEWYIYIYIIKPHFKT